MSKWRVTLGRARSKLPSSVYTILILPHSKSRFRKLQLSRGFVLTLVAVALAVVGAGLYSPHLVFKMHGQDAAIEQLLDENSELRREKADFEAALSDISGRLDAFESDTGKIASVLGVEGLPSSLPAAGGPGAANPVIGRRSPLLQEMNSLQGRADHLDESLDEIGDAFEERLQVLASTPSIMPVDGWFSHGFGWRKDPFTGKRQFHRGVDLVAEKGTPILATADGLISRAVRVPDYGKTVDISHGFGYVTRYGHMNEILVRPGQRVRRGDVIGLVGSTGRSTGPHVHYEVFRDSRRLNPWKYLGKRGR